MRLPVNVGRKKELRGGKLWTQVGKFMQRLVGRVKQQKSSPKKATPSAR